ncbi:MAG TPA: aminopeptidase N [Marmoricola sp.]|nr:aminopeptidase N [Marmoricola sp.]
MTLTLEAARERARVLNVAAYDIDLDLSQGEAEFASRTTVEFGCSDVGARTFIELHRASDVVAELNGRPLPAEAYDGARLQLDDLAEANVLTVSARLPYVHDGDGLHRFVDPADGEIYTSAYCGMDIAQRIFACFDQPDLKASLTLSVTAPEGQQVIANGVGTNEGNRWRFATTPRISTYLFVVCVGRWHSRRFDHAGMPFGWHARASQADALDREFDWLAEHTRGCFDTFTGMFEARYPFDSYDQVFVPEHNWGALETPGAVTFRDEYLTPAPPTDPERAALAMVIAHEMAHMWFGDLATMRWWEDTWLNESFADYMGYRVGGQVSGLDVWTESALDVIVAYFADQRRSSHPVAPLAEEVSDVDAALGNFDALTYRKGRQTLRQLVTWLGDEAFLAGVNAYLNRFAFANATLADFAVCLDEAAPDRDVRAWVDAWLRTTGFDTLHLAYDGEIPVVSREGSRPHRVSLGHGVLIDLGDEPVRIPELAGRSVVPNATDETFARIDFDADTWAIRSRETDSNPITRAVLLRTAIDRVVTGSMSPVELLAQWLPQHLVNESNPEIVAYALGQLLDRCLPWLDPAEIAVVDDRLEELGVEMLSRSPERSIAIAAASVVLRTSGDIDALHRLLDLDRIASLDLTQDLRWAAVRRLAALGDTSAIDAELTRDASARGQLGARRARASVPLESAKEAAWSAMFDVAVSNREFEASAAGFWTPGQHDVVGPWLGRYVPAAIALAEQVGPGLGSRIGQAVPWLPLTVADLTHVRGAIAAACEQPLPTTLPRMWSDRVDDLTLALQIRG